MCNKFSKFRALVVLSALTFSVGFVSSAAMATSIKGGTILDMQTLAYDPEGDRTGWFICRDSGGPAFICGSATMWDDQHGSLAYHELNAFGKTIGVSDVIGVIVGDRNLNDGWVETQIVDLKPYDGVGACGSAQTASDDCVDFVGFTLSAPVPGVTPISIGIPDVGDEIMLIGTGLQAVWPGSGVDTFTMGAVGNTINCVGNCPFTHSAFFSVSTFNGNDPTDVLFEGLGLPGDSGGLAVDALTGEELGMMVGAGFGNTNILSFAYVAPWMNSYMAIPEPGTGVLVLQGLVLASWMRGRSRKR